MYHTYSFIYDKPKLYMPARTKKDNSLKSMISLCDACGDIDLPMSMGCEEYNDIDLCMACYNIGYQSIEQITYPKSTSDLDNMLTDISPRNIVRYRSPFPYIYLCIENGVQVPNREHDLSNLTDNILHGHN